MAAMRLLAIQPGAIGDFVLSLPGLAALRAEVGKTAMEIWAERGNIALVRHPMYSTFARPLVETGFDNYPVPDRALDALVDFDMVVSWRGSRLPEFVSAVQAAHPKVFFLPQFPPADQPQHLADFRRDQLVDLFGSVMAESAVLASPPRLAYVRSDNEWVHEFMRAHAPQGERLIVIHPGASGPRKQWGAEKFAAVATALARKPGRRLLISEGPLDQEAVEEMRRLAPGLAAERLSLGDLRLLGTVLSQSALRR